MQVVKEDWHFWLRNHLSHKLSGARRAAVSVCICHALIPFLSYLCCCCWESGLFRQPLFCSSCIPTSPVAFNLDQHHLIASLQGSFFYSLSLTPACNLFMARMALLDLFYFRASLAGACSMDWDPRFWIHENKTTQQPHGNFSLDKQDSLEVIFDTQPQPSLQLSNTSREEEGSSGTGNDKWSHLVRKPAAPAASLMETSSPVLVAQVQPQCP